MDTEIKPSTSSKPIVLLDLMSTVIPDPFYTVIETQLGDMKKFIAAKNVQAYIDFELGILDEAGYFANFHNPDSKRTLPFTPEEFKNLLLKTPAMFAPVKKLLEDYHDQWDFYLASNYSEWYRVHADNLGLDAYLQGYFVSCKMGVRKPADGYFKHIADTLQVPYERMYFVDDQPRNVEAAKNLGIHSFLTVDNWTESLIAAIKSN